jgi:hypothetical protein
MCRQCADQWGEPGRKRSCHCLEFANLLGAQTFPQATQSFFCRLRPNPCKCTKYLACPAASHCKLPGRSMLQLDNLLPQMKLTRRARRQINRTHRHLRRQTKTICSSSTARNDGLAALNRRRLNDLFNRRRPCAEAAFDGSQIHSPSRTQQLSPLRKARQRLINGRTFPKMQQRLGGDRCTFGRLLVSSRIRVLRWVMSFFLCRKQRLASDTRQAANLKYINASIMALFPDQP